MSQGPLCPNLTQKVQKEVSQMANRNLPCVMAAAAVHFHTYTNIYRLERMNLVSLQELKLILKFVQN